MIIDKNPSIDQDNKTITVKENIDTSEQVDVVLNGMIALMQDELDITDNSISIIDDSGVDWSTDNFVVIYVKL